MKRKPKSVRIKRELVKPPFAWSYKLARTTGRLTDEDNGIGTWVSGVVATPLGYVSVYGSRFGDSTRAVYRFMYRGREYCGNTLGRSLTHSALAADAHRFAKQIMAYVGGRRVR